MSGGGWGWAGWGQSSAGVETDLRALRGKSFALCVFERDIDVCVHSLQHRQRSFRRKVVSILIFYFVSRPRNHPFEVGDEQLWLSCVSLRQYYESFAMRAMYSCKCNSGQKRS